VEVEVEKEEEKKKEEGSGAKVGGKRESRVSEVGDRMIDQTSSFLATVT
jgi:hypothetical protein